MSNTYAAKDWIMRTHRSQLTWKEKGVLTVISQYQGSHLCCWVKQETLMEATGLDDRKLREVLNSLREKLYLVWTRVSRDPTKTVFGQNHYSVCEPGEWDRVRMRYLDGEHVGVNCSKTVPKRDRPYQNGTVNLTQNGAARPHQNGAINSLLVEETLEDHANPGTGELKTQDQDQELPPGARADSSYGWIDFGED